MRAVPLGQSSNTERQRTSTVERERRKDFFAVINSYKMFAMGE